MKKLNILRNFFLLGIFSVSVSAQSQIIFTKAGTGNPGDYGAAADASIYAPSSVISDGNGNLYIADYSNQRIRKINTATGLISTIAGTGVSGFSGDGGPAVNAQVSNPNSLAIDGTGNLFVCDNGNTRIRKIDVATGIIRTIAGTGSSGSTGDGGAATSAGLSNPTCVAIDTNGDLYVTDYSGNRVRKIVMTTGIISTIAGTGTSGFLGDGAAATAARLKSPSGVAIDNSGNIYIADYGNQRIRKVTKATGFITTIAGSTSGYSGDGAAATAALLKNPYSIMLDVNSNIYISDRGNNRIRKITVSTGVISTIAGNGTAGYTGDGGLATVANLNNPWGISLDGNNIYIADSRNNRIRKLDATTGLISTVAGTGSTSFTGDGQLASNAMLNAPYTARVDGNGNIFITDATNNRIRKMDVSTGIITTIAGVGTAGFSGDGGLASAAEFNNPSDAFADANGDIYIADVNNNRVRMITAATGIVNTIAGTGVKATGGDGGNATAAQFNAPTSIAKDATGNLYITELFGNRIRKITKSTGIISTIAGTGTGSYTGDGGAATAATIFGPWGVQLDANGNIYIAEIYNGCIRKIDAGTGIISTVAGTGVNGFSGDGGIATAAQLNNPYNIAFDANFNIYIADTYNQRVRKVTVATGLITTVAGSASQGFAGDGGPANMASLNTPTGISLDANGNLLISEFSNNRIRYVCFNSNPSVTATSQQIAFTGGNNTLYFYKDCNLISKIVPSGSAPVVGAIADSVWVETSVPLNGSQPYIQRHYGITPSINASSSSGTITLYYSQADFSSYNAAVNHGSNLPIDAADAANNKTNLLIMKRSGTSGDGTGLFGSYHGTTTTVTPTSVSWNNATSLWEVTFDVTGFSGFFATSTVLSVLPLRLVDFTGRLLNGNGLLNWKTSNETNTDHFDIERSADGTTFAKLDVINAAGQSSSELNYNYTDKTLKNQHAPVMYYRLKMADRDGKFIYSNVIALNISSTETAVSLYPNPVQQSATLIISATKKETVTINIIDQNGRTISSKKVDINPQTNNVSIDTEFMQTGIYTLKIKGPYTSKEIKLMKK